MERLPTVEQQLNINEIKEVARQIADMYLEAAKNYLDEGDLLKIRIANYYSERPETEQELINVLRKINESEIYDYVLNVKEFTGDPRRFIERMEKLYELQDVHNRRRQLATHDRIATDEEYELGVYADFIESQVRDAIFTLHDKGYRTFQSGFKEKNDRDQFIDFYNKNISVPEETLKYLKEKSVEIKIESFYDRTTLTLHPTRPDAVRLTEWKEIWDTLVKSLPKADNETVSDGKPPLEHLDFRRRQDLLRK